MFKLNYNLSLLYFYCNCMRIYIYIYIYIYIFIFHCTLTSQFPNVFCLLPTHVTVTKRTTKNVRFQALTAGEYDNCSRWNVATCSLVEVYRRFLKIEAVLTSETSACFNETAQRYIPEGCKLYVKCGSRIRSGFNVAS
jgi:hypothetical protein